MPPNHPPMSSSEAVLRWTGKDLVFRGASEASPELVVDGDNLAGTSPMRMLLLSVAGCMAIDVLMILEKSRVPVEALEVAISGDRAETPPRFFESIRLVYRVTGPSEEDEAKLQRAVALSRDTYCSVLHTLRPDVDLDIVIQRG